MKDAKSKVSEDVLKQLPAKLLPLLDRIVVINASEVYVMRKIEEKEEEIRRENEREFGKRNSSQTSLHPV